MFFLSRRLRNIKCSLTWANSSFPKCNSKVVFAHSLFYFESTKEIRETLRLLWDKVTPDAELCIAEWGMVESRKAAAAHRAAVNTQATLEAYRKGKLSKIVTSF